MSDKIIDLDTYRSIKKMPRMELIAFLVRYVENLSSTSPPISLRGLESTIRVIKGISEKRTDEVMKAVERQLGVLVRA